MTNERIEAAEALVATVRAAQDRLRTLAHQHLSFASALRITLAGSVGVEGPRAAPTAKAARPAPTTRSLEPSDEDIDDAPTPAPGRKLPVVAGVAVAAATGVVAAVAATGPSDRWTEDIDARDLESEDIRASHDLGGELESEEEPKVVFTQDPVTEDNVGQRGLEAEAELAREHAALGSHLEDQEAELRRLLNDDLSVDDDEGASEEAVRKGEAREASVFDDELAPDDDVSENTVGGARAVAAVAGKPVVSPTRTAPPLPPTQPPAFDESEWDNEDATVVADERALRAAKESRDDWEGDERTVLADEDTLGQLNLDDAAGLMEDSPAEPDSEDSQTGEADPDPLASFRIPDDDDDEPVETYKPPPRLAPPDDDEEDASDQPSQDDIDMAVFEEAPEGQTPVPDESSGRHSLFEPDESVAEPRSDDERTASLTQRATAEVVDDEATGNTAGPRAAAVAPRVAAPAPRAAPVFEDEDEDGDEDDDEDDSDEDSDGDEEEERSVGVAAIRLNPSGTGRAAPAEDAPEEPEEDSESVVDEDSVSQLDTPEVEDEDFGTGQGQGGGLSVLRRVKPAEPEPSAGPQLSLGENDRNEPPPGAAAEEEEPIVTPISNVDRSKITEAKKLAEQAVGRGDLDGAILYYRDMLDLEPENVDACLGRGRCLVELGDYGAAMSDFQKAEDLAPDSPEPLLEMGNLFFTRRDYRRAIDYYDAAVELDDSHAMARCKRGLSHYYRKGYPEAYQDLQKAYSLDPEIPNIRKYVQMVSKAMGRPS